MAWKCKRCGPVKKHLNVSKALTHISKLFGDDIHVAYCLALIPPEYTVWYRDLSGQKDRKKTAKKKAEAAIAEEITDGWDEITQVVLLKKRKQGGDNVIDIS